MSDQEPTVYNGRYELHRLIARGGMADVFLARDLLLDRPVAIKVLFSQFASDPSFVERFRREAQSAANLNHPNVVGVYDWGEEQGTYFIVMEYVEGRSLAEILRDEGMLHPDRAADIATDVAGALSFAHRNGVVHRDIKPGNILIDPNGQVKVTDFGIARAFGQGSVDSNLTQAGSVMGTATYFSPEQAQGQRVDPRSDLYSLGIVLYEMLASRPPFSGDSPVAIAYKQVQELPAPPSSINPRVPASIEAITMRLLQKDPADRYADAEELRGDLRRFREGVAVASAPTPTGAAPTAVTASAAPTTAVPVTAGAAPPMSPPGPGYEDDYEEPSSRTGWFIAGLVVLIAILVGLLIAFADALGLGGDKGEVARIEVPGVIEMEEAAALALLESKDFVVKVEREPNADIEPGRVFRQNPVEGALADEGSEVTVWVSDGAESFPMPNVVGSRESDAVTDLNSRGLETPDGAITYRNDDQALEGEVLEQTPPPGETVRRGDRVTLVVSEGPETVSVPDVSKETLADARRILTDAGFEVSDEPENSTSVTEGLVTRTNPVAREDASRGSRVTIFVSAGPPEPTMGVVPNVVNQTQSTAEAQLVNRGFNPVVTVANHPSVPVGNVISQSVDFGEELEQGSNVSIVISQGPSTSSSTTSTTEDPDA